MPEKTYTEAEVSALLGRAARLQASGGPSDREGLTLEEVKAAAVAAGIDPRYVELASSASSHHRQTYAGVPTGLGYSLVVRGALTDKRWRQMVAVFSRELGGPGEVSMQGATRSWSRGALRVTAEDEGDHVVLHAETEWRKSLEMPIAFALVGAIAAATMGGLALVSLEVMIGVAVALWTVLLVGAFSAYRQRTVAKEKRLRSTFEATFERCAAILYGDAEGGASIERSVTDAAARVALPEEQRAGDAPPPVRPRGRLHSG